MTVLIKSTEEDKSEIQKREEKNKMLVSVLNIFSTTRNIITLMPVDKVQRFVIWPLPASRNIQLI